MVGQHDFNEELVQKAAQGHFNFISKTIKSKELVLNQATVVKIIANCCRIICNQNELVMEDEVCDLLVTCTKHICTFEDRLCKPYLQSLYHIVNWLLKVEDYNSIAILEEILISKSIQLSKNESATEVYNSLSVLIYKTIEKLNGKVPDTTAFTIYLTSLKMFSQYFTAVKLLNVATTYFQSANFTKAAVELQCTCYEYLWIAILQNNATASTEHGDIYIAIIETLQRIVTNLFRKQEYERAKSQLSCASEAVSKLCNNKEYLQLISIVKCCFPPLNDASNYTCNLKKSCIDFKKLSNENENSCKLQKTCHLITAIIQEFMEHCIPLGWKIISEDILLNLAKLLDTTANILADIQSNCRLCSECDVETDLIASINTHSLIATLVKIMIDKSVTIPDDTFIFIIKAMKNCCLRITLTKNLRCRKWQSIWMRLRVVMFNSVIKLINQCNKNCISYGSLLANTLLKLEHKDNIVIEPYILSKTFYCLSETSYANNDFASAVVFAALEVFYSKDDLESVSFSQWISAKFKSDDQFKCLTIVCVLTEKLDVVKRHFLNLRINVPNEMKVKLLLRELEAYKKKWPSRIPMGAAINKLCDITDSFTIAKTIVQTWSEEPLENDDVKKIVLSIIKKLNAKETEVEEHLCLVLLQIMQYYIEMEGYQNSMNERISNYIPPNSSSSDTSNTANEQYNVVTFSDLNLNEYCKTTLYLTTALRYIKHHISESFIKYVNSYRLYYICENVAREFEQQGDSLHATEAWFVCYRLAEVINNEPEILKSASFVLKHANTMTETIQKMLQTCNTMAKSFESSSDPQIFENLCVYYVNKCRMLLNNDSVEEGLETYREALRIFMKISDSEENALLKLEFDFLEVRFMFLPCSVALENHGDSVLSKLFSVFQRINLYLKSYGGTKAIIFILEVYEYLIKMYRCMRFTREMRCYTRSALMFVQKQFLPLRIANLLTYFSYADIISLRFENVQVMLRSLAELLALKEPNANMKNTSSSLNELIENFCKITLASTNNALHGSPNFARKLIVMPEFLCHTVDCVCYYCTSFNYKSLVLMYFTLEAQLQVYMEPNNCTITCFDAAVEFCKYLNGNNESDFKINKVFGEAACMNLSDFLLETKCILLLDYGNHLLRIGHIEKATAVNTNLITAFTKRKRINAYAYNEAILQAIDILLISSTKQTPKGDSISVPDGSNVTLRTPARNKALFETSVRLKPNRRLEGDIPKLKFNISPSITPEKKKTVSFDTSTYKTPIRCEHLKSINSTKTKSSVLKEVDIPDDCDIIPQSPDAYTPNVLKLRSAREARTKLLSEKLKKSNVKIVVTDADLENICSTKARKNLMKELSDTELPTKSDQCTETRDKETHQKQRVTTRSRKKDLV